MIVLIILMICAACVGAGGVSHADGPVQSAPSPGCNHLLSGGSEPFSTDERALLQTVPIRRGEILYFLNRSLPHVKVFAKGGLEAALAELWRRAGQTSPPYDFGSRPRAREVMAAWRTFLAAVDQSAEIEAERRANVAGDDAKERSRAFVANLSPEVLAQIEAVPRDAVAIVDFFKRACPKDSMRRPGFAERRFNWLWRTVLGVERPWRVVMDHDADIVKYRRVKKHAAERIVVEWNLFLATLEHHR